MTVHFWCCALVAAPNEETACISRRSGHRYDEAGTSAAMRLGPIIGGELTGDARGAGSRPTPGTSRPWCAWRIWAGRARSRWAAATPACSGTSPSSSALQSNTYHCPQHWSPCPLEAAHHGLLAACNLRQSPSSQALILMSTGCSSKPGSRASHGQHGLAELLPTWRLHPWSKHHCMHMSSVHASHAAQATGHPRFTPREACQSCLRVPVWTTKCRLRTKGVAELIIW